MMIVSSGANKPKLVTIKLPPGGDVSMCVQKERMLHKKPGGFQGFVVFITFTYVYPALFVLIDYNLIYDVTV